MQRPVRVLLVGVGTRGKHWARLLHDEPLCRTTGYVDVDSAALAEIAAHYPVPSGALFTDLKTALGTVPADLVVLATPPMDHLAQALAIFTAGCHLLAEKPLTLDLGEAIQIVRAAEAADRSLTVGLNFRYLEATLAAKRLLAGGELGRSSFAHYLYWTNRDGRRPGINKYPLTMRQPMLYEQSIHHLDLFRFTYGAEVERLTAITHNPPWSMYADDASVFALLEMTGGLVVNYVGTWSGQSQLRRFEWRTDCTEGTLLQTDFFRDLAVVAKEADEPRPIPLRPQEDYIGDTRDMLRHILEQLLAGVARPEPSGHDHLKTLAVAAACEESARRHATVELADFARRQGVPGEWW